MLSIISFISSSDVKDKIRRIVNLNRIYLRFQKYSDRFFLVKRSLWGCFSVEDGQCLNSH